MAEGYGPIPNQRVKTTVTVQLSKGDSQVLPAGSFIKCIKKEYLPRNHPFENYDEKYYTAAFTKFGMALVRREDIDWHVL